MSLCLSFLSCLTLSEVMLLVFRWSTSMAGNTHVLHARTLLFRPPTARSSSSSSTGDVYVKVLSEGTSDVEDDGEDQSLSVNFGRKWRIIFFSWRRLDLTSGSVFLSRADFIALSPMVSLPCRCNKYTSASVLLLISTLAFWKILRIRLDLR